MKIALSSKDHSAGLHAVLMCEFDEQFNAQHVLRECVVPAGVKLLKERKNGQILFRLHMKYLPLISLAFPMAEYSTGIRQRLNRAEEKRLSGMKVPACSWPGFSGELYDYQKIAAKKIVDGEIDYLCDQMGLGKSFVVLAAMRKLKAFPALIVCPNNVKYVWEQYVKEYFADVSVKVVDGNKAERDRIIRKNADVTVCNFEQIRAKPVYEDGDSMRPVVGYEYANPALFEEAYEFVVIDEFHSLKNPAAQKTRGFFELTGYQWIMLSGTPILNRPLEIWSPVAKVYPDSVGTYNHFQEELTVKAPNSDKVVGYNPQRMADLKDFLEDVSLRRRKEQVFDQLPKVVEITRSVELNAEQRAIYKRVQDDLLLEREDGSLQNIFDARAHIIRMRQAAISPELFGGSSNSAKIDAVKEILEELSESGEKAIVFSSFAKACDILKRELSEYNPAFITGSVKNKDRLEQTRKFNEDDDCRVFIGSIGANREGINLGAASYVIFLDTDWVPANNDQAIGRSAAGGLRGAHLGPDAHVHVVYLLAKDTFEETLNATLRKKRAVFDRMVERDAGDSRIENVALTLEDLLQKIS